MDQQLDLFSKLPEEHFNVDDIPLPLKKSKVGTLQKRLYAFYIDFFVANLFAKGTLLSYWGLLKVTFPFLSHRFQVTLLKNIAGMEIAITIIAFFGHHMISQVLKNGQTLGKFIFDLSTIDPSAPLSERTLSQALKRSLVLTSSIFMMPFLALVPFARKDRRGVHCWISGVQTIPLYELRHLRTQEQQMRLAGTLNGATQLEMTLPIEKTSVPSMDFPLPMAA